MQSTIALVLTFLAMAGADAAATAAPSRAPALSVCLTMSPVLGIGARLESVIHANVSAIWQPYGVAVRPIGENRETCDRLIAVKSSVESQSEPESSDTSLAWVSFVEGRAARVIFLRLNRARALVRSLSPGPRHAALTDRLVAILVARSLAHELGHVLLNSTDHTASGLMRARYRANDILRDPTSAYTLDERQRGQLQANIGERYQSDGMTRDAFAPKR